MDENNEQLIVFPWNSNLETGITEIDEQHKKLVVLINKLANDLTREEIHPIEETINELADYANYHFESEEKIWDENISDTQILQSHKSTHNSFLPKVLELTQNNSDKSYHQRIEEVLLFLIRWLAFHIIDGDKKLALIIKFMNEGQNQKDAMVSTEHIMNDSMKGLIEIILSMFDNVSSKAIELVKEKRGRIKAENALKALNEELINLSITDALTGLYNRRHFDEIFESELNRAKRNKHNIGLILLDIDHFKKLNDTYGHVKGDKALKGVASAIKKVTKRSSEFAFRVGGEEFCILTTNENIDEMLTLADRLTQEIRGLKIENKNSDASEFLTVSGGIVSLLPNVEDTKDNIYKLADDRLYKVKESGRNKFCFE